MPKPKDQMQVFVYEAIPTIFHSDPQAFMNYLTRDGNKFLKFWWDHSGKKVKEENLASSEGLNYSIRELDKNNNLALITLPRHPEISSAYYLALYHPRSRWGFFIRRALTRVIVLEYSAGKEGSPRTTLAEITPSQRRVVVGQGPGPRIEEFFEAVCKLTLKKDIHWKNAS
jgi:hypothetical protein